MRADAQRNYDRIVEVAREVFREQGYDASLDLVAKRAEVGAGTLYRHFPTRDALLDALMQSWVDRVNEACEKSLAHEGSPRDLLVHWCTSYAELISLHKGGPAKLTAAMDDPQSAIAHKCTVLRAASDRVVARLHAEGALRPGLEGVQLCRLVGGVATVADQGDLDPVVVRSLLEVVADGMLA